jgi:hypothetical protein
MGEESIAPKGATKLTGPFFSEKIHLLDPASMFRNGAFFHNALTRLRMF